ETLEVVDRLDLLAEPAAHLATGVAGRDVDHVEVLVELPGQLEAAAVDHPGVLLARVHAERNGAGEGEGRILAEVVVGRGVAALHGAVLHGVEHLQPADDLAGREYLDGELASCSGRDSPADELRASV